MPKKVLCGEFGHVTLNTIKFVRYCGDALAMSKVLLEMSGVFLDMSCMFLEMTTFCWKWQAFGREVGTGMAVSRNLWMVQGPWHNGFGALGHQVGPGTAVSGSLARSS